MSADQDSRKHLLIKNIKKDIIEYLVFGSGLILTILAEIYSFILFHSIAELFSIIIFGCIFIIGWNSKKYTNGSLFLLLGVSFLFLCILDSIHTLSYSGIGIFIDYDSNLPTSLWIVARYTQAISLFIAILVKNKTLNPNLLIIIYTLVISLILYLIFTDIFPKCYIVGSGLTGFKLISEYIIILILFLAIILLFYFRKEFNLRIFLFLVISIIATMISEFAFTFYIGVYDFANELGHILKIIAAFFIYKALIETGFQNPFNLLFRKLKQSELSLLKKAHDLEEAYNEFNKIFNSSLPMRVIDNDCNIERVNDTYVKYFEMKREDVIGRKCYDLSLNPDCRKDTCPINRLQTGAQDYDHEVSRELPDGKKVYYMSSSLPWKDSNGKMIGLIQNFTDITDRKIAEKRLETFISTASHELRTPTTAMLQSIELISKYKQKISNDQRESLIETIARNAGFLAELIDDLLTISKIDEKKTKLDFIEINPIELVYEIIRSMELRIQSKNNIISIEHDNEIIMFGDISKLNQIFRILIDNGLKYSQKDTEFKIKMINHYKGKFNPEDQDGVLFKFIDQGIGIPKDDLSKLFERFFRSNSVNHIPGTGLGLVIAKEYIGLHHGKIFVESELGKGSIFSVFIPLINP
ncbi:MAG: PAS domain-containing protein [Candidatus Lokiarchaeota archaeon]|nr:PAS domain-containing protein [Candidatus Lokiarchaeota archaeon]